MNVMDVHWVFIPTSSRVFAFLGQNQKDNSASESRGKRLVLQVRVLWLSQNLTYNNLDDEDSAVRKSLRLRIYAEAIMRGKWKGGSPRVIRQNTWSKGMNITDVYGVIIHVRSRDRACWMIVQ